MKWIIYIGLLAPSTSVEADWHDLLRMIWCIAYIWLLFCRLCCIVSNLLRYNHRIREKVYSANSIDLMNLSITQIARFIFGWWTNFLVCLLSASSLPLSPLQQSVFVTDFGTSQICCLHLLVLCVCVCVKSSFLFVFLSLKACKYTVDSLTSDILFHTVKIPNWPLTAVKLHYSRSVKLWLKWALIIESTFSGGAKWFHRGPLWPKQCRQNPLKSWKKKMIPGSPIDRFPECFVISFMSASFRHFHSDRLKTHISWFLEVPVTKNHHNLTPR